MEFHRTHAGSYPGEGICTVAIKSVSMASYGSIFRMA